MGSYTNYKFQGAVPVLLSYTCSKCGESNVVLHNLVQAQTYQGSTPIRQAAKERQQQQAEAKFQDQMRDATDKFVDNVNNRRFRNLNVRCACRKCGNVEPWCEMNNLPARALIKLGIPVLIVMAILLFARGPVWVVATGLALVAALGVWALIQEWKLRGFARALKDLPEESFPKATAVKKP